MGVDINELLRGGVTFENNLVTCRCENPFRSLDSTMLKKNFCRANSSVNLGDFMEYCELETYGSRHPLCSIAMTNEQRMCKIIVVVIGLLLVKLCNLLSSTVK